MKMHKTIKSNNDIDNDLHNYDSESTNSHINDDENHYVCDGHSNCNN